MRRVIILAMMLLVSSAAFGEVQEFRNFSLDVPEGWTAEEAGAVVTVSANDRSGSLSITYDDLHGVSLADIVATFALELGGTLPEKDDDGDYSFDFNNGISHAVITGDEDFYMLIVGTGLVKNADVLGEILDSLEMK